MDGLERMDSATEYAIKCHASLCDNQDFLDQLSDPRVQKMLLHWMNKDRLSFDEADELGKDILVASVFQQIRKLGSVCKDAKIQTPLQLDVKNGAVKLLSMEQFLNHLMAKGLIQRPEPKADLPPPYTWKQSLMHQAKVMLFQLIFVGLVWSFRGNLSEFIEDSLGTDPAPTTTSTSTRGEM
eukprot:TRINITY_DN13033_c0_g1_i4.p1 TRINITY_DN13033_c0_g1~~TRINITY_DN13033_c0_g1_i4.p1  ORF type:complete len:182 (+),score=38.78 TRINITY_DN13033_c0_g1_i4:196-741(+)